MINSKYLICVFIFYAYHEKFIGHKGVLCRKKIEETLAEKMQRWMVVCWGHEVAVCWGHEVAVFWGHEVAVWSECWGS